MSRQGKPASPLSTLPGLLLGIATIIVLYLTSRYDYLLFHSLAEGFSIVVACGVFMVAWNARALLDNDYLLLLGISYLFIAALDFVHMLAYSGMGVFSANGANISTQIWVGARYMESITLLAAPVVFSKRLKTGVAVVAYAVVTALLLLSIFLRIFPDCYVEGQGLTPFKIGSEYLICAFLLGAAVLLYRNRSQFEDDVLRLLLASIVLTVVSEMFFTLYVDPYGFFNFLGHITKLVSYYFIYRAIIVTGIARPFDLFFRRLSRSEERLKHTQELANLGSWDLDLDKKTVSCSDEVYRICDLQPHEFDGRFETLLDCLHPEDRQQVYELFMDSIRKQQDFYEIEHRIVRRHTGEIRYVRQRCQHVRNENGRVVRSLGMVLDITARRVIEEKLRALNAELELRVAERTAEAEQRANQLQRLTLELTYAEERERQRLSGILHDDVQQMLAYARLRADMIPASIGDDAELAEIAQEITNTLANAIEVSRSLSRDLNPPLLRRQGLGPALEQLAIRTTERYGLEVQAVVPRNEPWLPEKHRIFVYRSTQELLFNAIKHAGASRLKLWLYQDEFSLRVVVEDDGAGFDPSTLRATVMDGGGLGLFGIEQRGSLLGWQLEIESAPGKGSRFVLALPDKVSREFKEHSA